jgi:hypothetical protein
MFQLDEFGQAAAVALGEFQVGNQDLEIAVVLRGMHRLGLRGSLNYGEAFLFEHAAEQIPDAAFVLGE